MNAPPSAPLSRPRLLGFGVGSVGTGVFSALPGLLLLYYLTDVLGVVAWLAGLVLVLPKFWDVVISPVIGAASDREAVRTGGRSRLMFAGALLLPALFAAMFAAPTAAPAASALWVLLAFVLATTAFSLFQVPYIALPAEISPRRCGDVRGQHGPQRPGSRHPRGPPHQVPVRAELSTRGLRTA